MKLKKIIAVNFQVKLVVLISFIAFIALLASALYVSFVFKQTTLQITRSTLKIVAEKNAALISSQLDHNFKTTEFIAAGLDNDKTEVFLKKVEYLKKLFQSKTLPEELIMIEYFNTQTGNSTVSKNKDSKHIFIYKIPNGYNLETDQKLYKKLPPVPTESEIIYKNVFQSPEFIQISGGEYFVYSITASLKNAGLYSGYIRVFFSLDKINEIIQETRNYKQHIKSVLISGKEEFLSVTDKNYLKGKDIQLVKNVETKIYEVMIAGVEEEEMPEKIITFSKVNFNNNLNQWLLLIYASDKNIMQDITIEGGHALIWAAVIWLFIFIFIILVIELFFRHLNKLFDQAESFMIGENNNFDEETPYPEINKLSRVFNQVIKRRNEISNTAKAIVNNDYMQDIKPLSSLDITADSLNKINKKLQEIEAENKQEKDLSSQRAWKRKGLLEITEVQQKSNNETKELSYKFIRTIVKYTDALMGAIYIKRTDSNDNEYLEVTGAYAYEEKRSINVKFNIGEGMPGTCARERKKIYLEKLPDDYMTIGSGMGKSKPGFAALFPIFAQGKLVAVIEISFMKRPDEYILNFIEQLNETIGSTLNTAEIQTHTETLLELSNKKTIELSEKEAELSSLIEAINKTVLVMLYSPDGKFISANDRYYNITGYTEKDLIGTNIFDLVKEEKAELKDIIEQVKTGKSIERKVIRYTKKGEPVNMKANYAPHYDRMGNITRIIFFGIEEKNN